MNCVEMQDGLKVLLASALLTVFVVILVFGKR